MNKIVLITGASSGYGKATAKAFKENGDVVIMAARKLPHPLMRLWHIRRKTG